MGDRDRGLSDSRRQRAERQQRMTMIHAVLACLVFLILIQFLLLMVAVDAFLGARPGLLVPALAASGLCFSGSCWLVRNLSSPSASRRPS